MRKLICGLSALSVVLGLSLTSAQAADKPKGDAEQVFKRLDKDSDGKLTEAGFSASAPEKTPTRPRRRLASSTRTATAP